MKPEVKLTTACWYMPDTIEYLLGIARISIIYHGLPLNTSQVRYVQTGPHSVLCVLGPRSDRPPCNWVLISIYSIRTTNCDHQNNQNNQTATGNLHPQRLLSSSPKLLIPSSSLPSPPSQTRPLVLSLLTASYPPLRRGALFPSSFHSLSHLLSNSPTGTFTTILSSDSSDATPNSYLPHLLLFPWTPTSSKNLSTRSIINQLTRPTE